MDPNPAWRKYMSLIPTTGTTSVETGAQAVLETGSLKRRRVPDTGLDEKKRAKRKLIEDNVSESRLLRLPAEIRRLIFQHVLGGHHVHVEQLHLGNVDRYEKKEIHFGRGLYNEICREAHAEATAYDRFLEAKMGKDGKPTPFGTNKDGEDIGAGYHVDSWTQRHIDCGREPQLHRFNVELDKWMRRDYLSLSCLRTCKLIYKEMRMLPYTENVILFRKPMAFQAFSSTCRTDQFRAIQHLSVPVAIGSAPFSDGRDRLWTSVLWNYHFSGRLRRLKYLDITAELYFPRSAFDHRPNQRKPVLEDCISELLLRTTMQTNESTEWTKEFSHLSRKQPKFRVVVCDDPQSAWGVSGSSIAIRDWRIDGTAWMSERNQKALTIEQKQRLAQQLEERLLVGGSSSFPGEKKLDVS